MRDRSKEIAMLEDTLKILKQGLYVKNGNFFQKCGMFMVKNWFV